MHIDHIDGHDAAPAFPTAAPPSPTAITLDPPRGPADRATMLLGAAAEELSRTLKLVVDPPRPSFHGQSAAQAAAGTLAIAGRLLADALAQVRSAGDGLMHPATAEHATQALATSGDARELMHELLAHDGTLSPDALRATAGMIEQALAHARAALATSIGEP
jgi:hypothetical protein